VRRQNATGFLLAPVFLCALLLPSADEAATADSSQVAVNDHPPLWAQAVAVFDAGKELVPGTVLQKIQELDDEGRVKSELNIETRLALDEAGSISSDIVRASKNGKDVTAEQRKKAKEAERRNAKGDSNGRSHAFSLEGGPFDPEIQDKVRVAATESRDTIDGRTCAVFEFSYPEKGNERSKNRASTVSGTAWIDTESGRPAKLEFMPDPLPKHVKHMLTTLRFGADEAGSWVVREVRFDVSGSFLFFGKRILGDFRFSDYWRNEQRPQ
jgi:hypothetical protein